MVSQKSLLFLLYARDKHAWPRDGLRLYPTITRKGESKHLESIDDAVKFCQFNKDVFINLFSEDQKKSKTYDMIFLDIDHHDIQKAFMKMVYVCHKIKESGIKHMQVIFSGSKGYHIYVPLKSTFLSHYRESVIEWLREIGIVKHIDIGAIETNRVTRVPLSINSKSGLSCYPLAYDENIDKLNLEDLLNGKYVPSGKMKLIPNDTLGEELKEYDRVARSLKSGMGGELVIGSKSEIFTKPSEYPECMQVLLEEAEAGTDLGHMERLELGKFLLHITGGDVEKVKKIYSKMSDFNDHKTSYHLNYIIRRNLKLLSCGKMAEYGLCPIKDQKECPFYPSINHFISIEREGQHKEID